MYAPTDNYRKKQMASFYNLMPALHPVKIYEINTFDMFEVKPPTPPKLA